MTVKYETPHENVALITLNRPHKLNAFDADARRDFRDALRKASFDEGIRAVVITGEGRAFSAGADISALDDGLSIEDVLNTEYGAFLSVIQTIPKPVIAAVNGPAAGIGMTTALTCDLKVMGKSAYLMSAFANIGLVPDGGLTWILTQQIGYSRAYQLAIEAEKIDAERALEWGLVNRVVDDSDVVSNALEWAQAITERAPIAMDLTKRAMRSAASDGLRNAMAYEAMAQRTAAQSNDTREGVMAVMQKRKPQFTGT